MWLFFKKDKMFCKMSLSSASTQFFFGFCICSSKYKTFHDLSVYWCNWLYWLCVACSALFIMTYMRSLKLPLKRRKHQIGVEPWGDCNLPRTDTWNKQESRSSSVFLQRVRTISERSNKPPFLTLEAQPDAGFSNPVLLREDPGLLKNVGSGKVLLGRYLIRRETFYLVKVPWTK